MAITFRDSQYGDHAPAACEAMRVVYDSEAYQRAPRADIIAYAIGGYHAGWGICAGRVGAPADHVARSEAGTGNRSPFVRRALAGQLPAKEIGR